MTETLRTTIDVAAVRDRFSSLRGDFAFLDAPGGSQVPDEVGDAIARTLREASANMGAGYATSQRVGRIAAAVARRTAGSVNPCRAATRRFGSRRTSAASMTSRSPRTHTLHARPNRTHPRLSRRPPWGTPADPARAFRAGHDVRALPTAEPGGRFGRSGRDGMMSALRVRRPIGPAA